MNKRLTAKFLAYLSIVLLFMLLVLAGLAYLPQTNFVKQQNELEPAELLDSIAKKTSIQDGKVIVASSALQPIKDGDGWLQILSSEGKVVYQYHMPQGIQTAYAPGELLVLRKSPKAFGYQVYTWFISDNPQKLTWIYAVPYMRSSRYNFTNDYRTWLAVAGLSLAVTLLVAFLFGMRMGMPILHMLSWINNLSKGDYREPVNKRGTSISRKSNGKLRKSYQTFHEMIDSFEALSRSLNESDKKKMRLDAAREEWIAGISHDMKTPLSSVKGYADLLSSEQYAFSREQTAEYAGIISEKANYMQNLINDLNLTFSLSNHALPIEAKPQNLVELTRRSVIDLVNSGLWSDINFTLQNTEEENIFYPVDAKWFRRAVDNLLANAAVHNDAGTTVTVLVRQLPKSKQYPLVEFIIKDNGKGMDEQVLAHLFDRYYRGTSTNHREVKGSGLGTAIAKQLIEAHGGSISVQSELQRGTTFIIRLPEKN